MSTETNRRPILHLARTRKRAKPERIGLIIPHRREIERAKRHGARHDPATKEWWIAADQLDEHPGIWEWLPKDHPERERLQKKHDWQKEYQRALRLNREHHKVWAKEELRQQEQSGAVG